MPQSATLQLWKVPDHNISLLYCQSQKEDWDFTTENYYHEQSVMSNLFNLKKKFVCNTAFPTVCSNKEIEQIFHGKKEVLISVLQPLLA